MTQPTYREILLSLEMGQSHTFPNKVEAASARAKACLLGDNLFFSRKGLTLTRVDYKPMIHNSSTVPVFERIMELAARPEGVTTENGISGYQYVRKLHAKKKLFTTKASIGREIKHYFDSQERADEYYKDRQPSKKTHPKVKKELLKSVTPVKFASTRPLPGGPARLPGEPIITAQTKITIAPPPPAVLMRSNTFSHWG